MKKARSRTAPSGGSIDVRLDRLDNQARLTVRDTGQGIAADFLPHVFELFRQGADNKARSRGLGIGLAIVSQIVGLHHGTVLAASAGPGQGATFTVTLPLLPDEEAANS